MTAAVYGALLNGRGNPDSVFAREIQNQINNLDPRARTSGFDRRVFTPGEDNDIQRAEAFAVNEMQGAGTGTFRGLRDSVLATANQVGLEDDVAAARDSARRAAKVNEQQFERATRSLDISDRQKKAAERKLSLNRAVSEAAAGSGVRRTSAANARTAMRAGLDLENMSFQQMVSGLTGLANAEGQRRVRIANEKANKRAERNSWISTAIGAGIGLLSLSSEEAKDKEEINPDLLSKLKGLRVDRWKYKGAKQKHIGPYAEEFNDTFGTEGDAGDKRFINLIDAVGVALGGLKQLDQKVEALSNAS